MNAIHLSMSIVADKHLIFYYLFFLRSQNALLGIFYIHGFRKAGNIIFHQARQ